jgi:hypothetical protein
MFRARTSTNLLLSPSSIKTRAVSRSGFETSLKQRCRFWQGDKEANREGNTYRRRG